jgi:hypothetical protein
LLLIEILGEENFVGEYFWLSKQDDDSSSLTNASVTVNMFCVIQRFHIF